MEELRLYLNSLSIGNQREFESSCETTIGYIRKAISVKQQLRASLCVSIEVFTSGKISRQMLRPDDWQKIWPELNAVKSSYAQQTALSCADALRILPGGC